MGTILHLEMSKTSKVIMLYIVITSILSMGILANHSENNSIIIYDSLPDPSIQTCYARYYTDDTIIVSCIDDSYWYCPYSPCSYLSEWNTRWEAKWQPSWQVKWQSMASGVGNCVKDTTGSMDSLVYWGNSFTEGHMTCFDDIRSCCWTPIK